MTFGTHRLAVAVTSLSVILIVSAVSLSFGLQSSSAFSNAGMISYWPRVNITVDVGKVIGVNNLSLGFQLDWNRWKTFIDQPVQQQMAQDAGFRLVRVFEFRSTNPSLKPCTSWNESAETGTWNWANIDALTQKIFEVGAEPLFCLGWARDGMQNYVPPGMAIDPSTDLPYPDSWGTYCREWVKHFKQNGMPVRFYETMNEPWTYYGWDNYTRIDNFMAVFNAAAQAMKTENPNVFLSFDGTNRKVLLNYWLASGGADLGFISFHKYDSWTIGQYDDDTMLNRAETYQIVTSPSYYGIQDVRQIYHDARGKWIPVINSESNFNSAWETGTDPKVQQMVGSTWLALVLRTSILEGLYCNVYFEFSSNRAWELANRQSGGWGLGMTDEVDNEPWYPYYVNKMIGCNLAVGDSLVETSSSVSDVRSIAWNHNGKLLIFLICKVDQKRTVVLEGINQQLDVSWIDGTITYEYPSLQSCTINATQPLILNGYTVMLLQSH